MHVAWWPLPPCYTAGVCCKPSSPRPRPSAIQRGTKFDPIAPQFGRTGTYYAASESVVFCFFVSFPFVISVRLKLYIPPYYISRQLRWGVGNLSAQRSGKTTSQIFFFPSGFRARGNIQKQTARPDSSCRNLPLLWCVHNRPYSQHNGGAFGGHSTRRQHARKLPLKACCSSSAQRENYQPDYFFRFGFRARGNIHRRL